MERKRDWHPFWGDRIVRCSLATSAVLNGILWAMFAFALRPSPYPLILHYTPYAGVDLLGSWTEPFYLAGLGLAVLVGNSALAKYFYLRERMVSLLVAASIPVIETLLVAAGIFIVQVNQ